MAKKEPNNPPLMNAMERGVTKPSSYQRETNLIDLPIDIIINILNKLPLNSLFLFHFVCRLWRALLYTPRISPHIKQVSDVKHTLMRSCDCSYRAETCRFKIPIELNSLEFFLLEPVNGILCIIGPILSHVTFVYLWNPLTSEFKPLPKPNAQMGYVAIGFGFGFVPSTNDYKVVRVIKHERKSDTRVEIYSLNRNSWRRVEDSCSSSEITGNETGGNFWNSRSHACHDRFRNGVLTVDLEKEVIIEVEPRYVSRSEGEHRRKQCRTISWTDHRDAISLTLPEDDLVLCPGYNNNYSYRSPTEFAFSGSLVSLNRDHNDLG